ncbi:MAG: hypothetical protein C4332_04565 [Meiothermus sp.]
MNVQHLAGIILSSPDPERLADFYREAIGIPFEPQRHGRIREHLEAEFGGVHFAILKKTPITPGGTVVPSFRVADLTTFLTTGAKPLHPILELGQGKWVCTIADPDGNPLRLIEIS